MVTNVEIKGFDDFAKYTETIAPNGPTVLFYFSGSKLPNGDSWCPDCVEGGYWVVPSSIRFKKLEFNGLLIINAEPIVKAFLTEVKKDVIFVYVDVGDREYWKDRACPFRTDSRTKLMVIPTLIKWKGVQRLEGSQCCNRELLQMLFEEDD